MPVKTKPYLDEEIVVLAKECRELHLKLKDEIHKDGFTHQNKVPTRRELITMSATYTKIAESGIRLCKARDKRLEKINGTKPKKEVSLHRVDELLEQWIELPLEDRLFSGSTVTGLFTDWAYRTRRTNGKEILLQLDKDGYANDDPFVKLFEKDLKQPGSGPDIHKIDKNGNVILDDKKKPIVIGHTPILDEDGKQINKFYANKHMVIFKDHYPRKPKNDTYALCRETVTAEENPTAFALVKEYHTFITGPLKAARHKYDAAIKALSKLQTKQDEATKIGDRSNKEAISRATQELKVSKISYIDALNTYGLSHNIE